MQKIISIAHTACRPEVCELPDFKTGDIINVHSKIKDKEGGKERTQQFQGTVLQIKGERAHIRMVTVRKLAYEVGIERIFPMPSPNIAKVEVKRIAENCRAKLSYLRDLKTTKTKIKYKIKSS